MKTIKDIVDKLAESEADFKQIRRRSIWQGKENLPKDGTVFIVPIQFGYDRCFYDSGYWWYYRSDVEDDGSGYAAGPEPEMWWPTENSLVLKDKDGVVVEIAGKKRYVA